METRTATRAKSLREIWLAADQSTMDIMKDSDTSSKTKDLINTQTKDCCIKPVPSYVSSLEKVSTKGVQGLFQHPGMHKPNDNSSLHSIWTPTIKDKLMKDPENACETPIANFKTYNIANIDQINADETTSNNDTESELSNNYDSEESLDCLNEETFGKFSEVPNETELTLDGISEATAACSLSNTDQHKSQTPGKSNISSRIFQYSTAQKDVQEVESIPAEYKTVRTKVYRNRNTPHNYRYKGGKNNFNVKGNNNRKNHAATKVASKEYFSNLSPLTSDSEVINVSRKNVVLHEARPLQGRSRKYPSNEHGKITTSTFETIQKRGNISYYTSEKVTFVRGQKQENVIKKMHNNNQENIVWKSNICDPEISINSYAADRNNYQDDFSFHKFNKGNKMSNTDKNGTKHFRDSNIYHHYTKGIASNTNDKHSQIDYVSHRVTERRLYNNDETDEKYFQDSPVFHHYTKGRKISNSYGQTYVKHNEQKCGKVNNLRIGPSRFNSRKQNFGHNQYGNPLKRENITSLNNQYGSSDISNTNETEQGQNAVIDLFKLAEYKQSDESVIQATQCEASGRQNEPNPNIANIENYGIKNKVNAEVYDPKLRRPLKKKILIEQYNERVEERKISSDALPNEKAATLHSVLNEPSIRDFQHNLQHSQNLDSTDKETTAQTKSIEMKMLETDKSNNINAKKQIALLIHDAKEIADLIVGCQRGLDMFKSFYFEWESLREKSISLLEKIVETITHSARKGDKFRDVILAVNAAAGIVALVPHPKVALTAKIVGAVGGALSKVFRPRNDNKDLKDDVNAKEFEIKEVFQQDIDSSSLVYIYGVQCGSQFEETCQNIHKFHQQMQLLEGSYHSYLDDALLDFVNEISEYNTNTFVVFYKKLQQCYETLIKNSKSEDSKAFVRVFDYAPGAVDIIDLLPWKFDSDGFDNSIIQVAWDDLFLLFQDSNSADLDTILHRIQNCLFFLKKERRILSRNVVNLFRGKS